MNKVFQNDLENSIEINPETWKNRPLYEKFLEKLFSFIMKTVAVPTIQDGPTIARIAYCLLV